METTVVDRRPEWLKRLHDWRVEHVSERMFMIILALLVGFFAAVAAFVLHWIINQIVTLLTSSFNQSRANWLYLVYPVVGIYLTSLFVRYIVKDNISHGITRILYGVEFYSKDAELSLRWLQFGVFSPINRLHSSKSEFTSKEP